MQRRDFLRNAGLGVAAGTLAAPAIAQSQPQVRWRMASSFPKSLDTLYGTAELVAGRVSRLTEGRFEIRIFRPFKSATDLISLRYQPAICVPVLPDGKATMLYWRKTSRISASPPP